MALRDTRISGGNGIDYTKECDSPSDYASMPNSTYFKDLSDGLIYFKNKVGLVFGLFTKEISNKTEWGVNASGSTRASYGVVTSGYGTPSNNNDTVTGLTKYTTSATAGDYAGIETTVYNQFPIDANPVFSAYIKTDSDITNQRFWAGLFTSTLLNSDDQTGAYLSFRYSTVAGDTTFKIIVDSGSAQTVLDTTVTVSANTYYLLEIFVDFTNSKIYFRVNGGSLIIVTTNIPASGTDLGFSVELTNPSAGARAFNFARIKGNNLL